MHQPILLPNTIGPKDIWGNLHGSSLPLVLAEYCHATPGIKLVITPDNQGAHELETHLRFFLGKGGNTQPILLFPDWETLPFDTFSPHQDIISKRLYTLNQLQHATNAIVIASVSTLLQQLPPPAFLNQFAFVIKQGQTFNLEQCRTQLQASSYRCMDTVYEHGEFAVRGNILDIFPMGSPKPFRVELFDDTIESLRYFDPETQRTIKKVDSIDILPAREFPLNEDSVTLFRQAFRETFSIKPSTCPIYEAVSNHQAPGGIEYYLPLFFEETATFFDYLPTDTALVLMGAPAPYAEKCWDDIQARYEQRGHDITRPILPPERCFMTPHDFLNKVKNYHSIRADEQSPKRASHTFNTTPPPALQASPQATYPLQPLIDFIAEKDQRVLLSVESAGRREALLELLGSHDISPQAVTSWENFCKSNSPINIVVSPITQGMVLPEQALTIVVESQLFGKQQTPQQQRHKKIIDPDLIIRHLAELQIGAPVVHLDFGVGRYQGLQTLSHDKHEEEFLVLCYANDDKVYVPVTSLNLISRYTGADPEHAPLHRLGTDRWQKEKKKAAESVHDIATELLELYAKRKAKPGITYTLHQDDYKRFSQAFPFTETTDQSQAIDEIVSDMQSPQPMDRLICGDVGFGKTEVAMRAAFVAVADGKQVCVLVPTTLLAKQHYESFQDRFADHPVRIELLSRFLTKKKNESVIDSVKAGQTDIVIGTHKLLQKHIQFKRLGLLIIDEEHRFGVQQKEHLKTLRAEVDVLSLTATPIPRTLNMAMAGIRDISLIATPPAKRLAIRTFWQEKNDTLIHEGISREILRGGQVFYLHNRVETIEQAGHHIQTLLPEAKVRVAHGQMRERELEQIMSDFYHHRFNVLVCTTIIENGIDIPTANTIIIDRADTFGLAQLHQLRGRVGRSHHQAYAYLLTPHRKRLTQDAIKRLDAIVSLEELGAGFILATHDLEIRGAGELLGEDQSGNIHAVGFTLFMEMLDDTIRDLKDGKLPSDSPQEIPEPEIHVDFSTIIPNTYIADTHTRLIIYKRIATASDQQALHTIQVELVDRFGLLPQSVKHLFHVTEIKWLAKSCGIANIQLNKQQGQIEFDQQPNIDPAKIIQLIQTEPSKYKLKGSSKLSFTLEADKPEDRLKALRMLMQSLHQPKGE